MRISSCHSPNSDEMFLATTPARSSTCFAAASFALCWMRMPSSSNEPRSASRPAPTICTVRVRPRVRRERRRSRCERIPDGMGSSRAGGGRWAWVHRCFPFGHDRRPVELRNSTDRRRRTPCPTDHRTAPPPRPGGDDAAAATRHWDRYVADMDFALSARADDVCGRMWDFMREQVFPAEPVYDQWRAARGHDDHEHPPVLEGLKVEARKRGLWNLFSPELGELTNLEYASVAEITGWSPTIAPEVTNCGAPDTGNMETLMLFGTPEQKERWLQPLLD